MFDSKKNLTVWLFKYHDIRASNYCKQPKSFRGSKSIVNLQNDDNNFLLWSTSAHKYNVHNHREKVSHFEKQFQDFNRGHIQFPLKIK